MTDILERSKKFGITLIGSKNGIPAFAGTREELEAFLASEKRELEEKLAGARKGNGAYEDKIFELNY
jgi:hypothetical protein